MPQLVPNPGRVLATSSSLWAAYGAIVLFVGDKAVEYLQSPAAADLGWKDAVLGVLLFAIPILRILYQQSLASATERQLQEEKLTREQLEEVATSPGPPLTPGQVKDIKKDAAAAATGSPTLKE